MFHGDRFGACDLGIAAGPRRWAATFPTRDAGAPTLFPVAAAARLTLSGAALSKAGAFAACDEPVAVAVPALAALALAGTLRLGVFRWASANGITQTASNRVT